MQREGRIGGSVLEPEKRKLGGCGLWAVTMAVLLIGGCIAIVVGTEDVSSPDRSSGIVDGETRLSLPNPETVPEWFAYNRDHFALLNEDFTSIREAFTAGDLVRLGDLCYALTGDTLNLRLVPSPDAEVQAALDPFLALIDQGAGECTDAVDSAGSLQTSTETFARAIAAFESFKTVLASKGVAYE